MEEIIRQLKYDVQRIEININAIKKTKEKMKKWIGKPIYNSCEEQIITWNKEIEEHRRMIDIYYQKLLSVKKL